MTGPDGWRQLHAMFTEKQGPNIEDKDCPRDGFTLLPDPEGAARCPFCGWRSDGAQ